MRGRTALLVASIIAPSIAAILAGCGGGGAVIAVTLTPDFAGSYTPGAGPADFKVRVTNDGPGNASGVVVHVDMPSSFRYKVTNNTSASGAAQTQPLEAHVGDSSPQWGIWELSAPTSPNGVTTYASVTIDFAVDISAEPNTYSLAGRVIDDDLTNAVVSRPVLLAVNAAPSLGVSATVSAGSVHASGTVTYRITVTNTGTGIAGDVGVLVTLPPVLTFQSSITPFQGNASRDQPVDPPKNSIIVFYGGFTLPPATSLGPGFVTIAFEAKAASTVAAGMYTINVQVTDLRGDTASIQGVAKITVIAGTTATPTPFETPAPTPSP